MLGNGNIPKDKIYHFIAGALIALIMGFITDPITGIGFAIGAGAMKECYDDFYKETKFDLADMLVTWIGGCVGFTLVALVQYWR